MLRNSEERNTYSVGVGAGKEGDRRKQVRFPRIGENRCYLQLCLLYARVGAAIRLSQSRRIPKIGAKEIAG